mgnify:CR=1 FL=1
MGRIKGIGENKVMSAEVGKVLIIVQILRVEGIRADRKESRLRVQDDDNKRATFKRDHPDTW